MHGPSQSLVVFLIIKGILVRDSKSTPIGISGTVSETHVTDFEFVQELINPCGIRKLERSVPAALEPMISYFTDDNVNNDTLFYEAMIIAIDNGLETLRQLLASSASIGCSGFHLESFPTFSRSLKTMNEAQLMREVYKVGIFLAVHLHLMGYDRQTTIVGSNDVSDDEVEEDEPLPLWRYKRCGNESDFFIHRISDMTLSIRNILCTVVTSATLEQSASFRKPYDELAGTTFNRYHGSCTDLQVRDCIVMREARVFLESLAEAFIALLRSSSNSPSANEIY